MFSYFFKNVVPFRYEVEGDVISEEMLLAFIPQLKHVPIKASQKEAFGFSSIVGFENDEQYIHSIDGWILLSLTFQKKNIKKSLLNRRFNDLKIITNENNFKMGKAKLTQEEEEELRAKVYLELLTEVQPDEDYLNVIVDTYSKNIYLSNDKAKYQKVFTNLMRKGIESFSMSNFNPHGVGLHLTQWLYKPTENLPSEISLEDSTYLTSEQSARARLTKQDLHSDEIQVLINHGKKCSSLGISFLERLSLTLHESCKLSKVKFSDQLMAEVREVEEPSSRFDEMLPFWEVMCSEFTSFYEWLDRVIEQPV